MIVILIIVVIAIGISGAFGYNKIFQLQKLAKQEAAEKSAQEEKTKETAEQEPNQDYALCFDGDNNYVEIADHNSLHLNYGSIELWFKPTKSFNSSNFLSQTLIGKEATGFNIGDFDIRLDNGSGKLKIYIDNEKEQNTLESDFTSWDEKWYQAVITLDKKSIIKLYINGQLQGEAKTIKGNMSRADTLYFATLRAGTLFPFKGCLDDIRIYKRALSEQEINKHYNKIYEDESELISYWDFNEGSGQMAFDQKGLNHGRIYNASYSLKED